MATTACGSARHYKRPPNPENFDQMAYFRELFHAQRTSRYQIYRLFQKNYSFMNLLRNYFDAFPPDHDHSTSHAMSEASSESNFDVRRFRPNIVLDTEADGFVENEWVGKRLQLGSAVLSINAICPRCVMTTHGFADLPKDPKVMRHLVQHNDGNVGVYASVEKPGNIKLGDKVEWLSSVSSVTAG